MLKRFKVWFFYILYISTLAFKHSTLRIDELLHPGGHAGDQLLEDGG